MGVVLEPTLRLIFAHHLSSGLHYDLSVLRKLVEVVHLDHIPFSTTDLLPYSHTSRISYDIS